MDFFKLKEHNTTIATEFRAGFTKGLAFGFITYFISKIMQREFKDINIAIIVLAFFY